MRRVGEFELGERLGKGGMGEVFRARDLRAGRDVALKLIRQGLDPEDLLRFKREAEVVASLSHPGIVRVHDCGIESDGTAWIAYEAVEGARGLLDAAADLEREERPGLLLQAARALAQAHAQGVIHRDVKPENVLVDAAGRVLVIDFGLAKVESAEALTQTGTLMGTPYAMAPEQVTGDPVSAATDVWALGVSLYRLLTDRLPFEGPGVVALLEQITSADPPRPRVFAPEVSPAVEAVCLGCLKRDPSQRFADAGALADALEAALAEGGERLRTGPLLVLSALALGAAALVVGLALTYEPAGEERVRLPEPAPVQPTPEVEPEPDPPKPEVEQLEPLTPEQVEEVVEAWGTRMGPTALGQLRVARKMPAGEARDRMLAEGLGIGLQALAEDVRKEAFDVLHARWSLRPDREATLALTRELLRKGRFRLASTVLAGLSSEPPVGSGQDRELRIVSAKVILRVRPDDWAEAEAVLIAEPLDLATAIQDDEYQQALAEVGGHRGLPKEDLARWQFLGDADGLLDLANAARNAKAPPRLADAYFHWTIHAMRGWSDGKRSRAETEFARHLLRSRRRRQGRALLEDLCARPTRPPETATDLGAILMNRENDLPRARVLLDEGVRGGIRRAKVFWVQLILKEETPPSREELERCLQLLGEAEAEDLEEFGLRKGSELRRAVNQKLEALR